MLTKYTHRNVTWIDLESPTKEEVHKTMEEYSIHPSIAEELLMPTLKPRVDLHENFIYLILHFPAFRHTHNYQQNQEVDFIIGKDFIITTRYDTIDPLHKFSKLFEVDSILDKSNIGTHAGFVFFFMLKKLYKALEHELEYINDALETIEEDIFKGYEKEMVISLSIVSRDLLNFRQALRLHKEILESFEEAGTKFFGKDFVSQIRSIIGEYYRISNIVRAHTDSLDELRATNNSLVSTKQNEVMKVLTIMAFITFPLSVIASIFGMNTHFLPIVGSPNDFWVIMGIMLTFTVFIFILFKYKKWL
ncbi:MAG: CorA family divalent cation transporter [Candidatus Pacebacteria bacterium]|jgi:magnesium transporter|nr:CorA family divalent cation transporter [Candidatus Paceibacterota bacterium]|tara:strand:+ start:8430 stop:9344 length:915 start_codon:yes stop_codon:yes gene_type:complete